mmetsp:Transcript_19322/g.44200  ORF Transcript_19322/g.44200 Transcript_19322/m.44200 type:complete len:121 (-) Transcript_19322:150-512(-)
MREPLVRQGACQDLSMLSQTHRLRPRQWLHKHSVFGGSRDLVFRQTHVHISSMRTSWRLVNVLHPAAQDCQLACALPVVLWLAVLWLIDLRLPDVDCSGSVLPALACSGSSTFGDLRLDS